MKFIERYITDRILEALKSHPIVFLNGARQTGKSTLVQNIAKKIGKEGVSATYVTFDKPTQMAAASSAPEMFLSAYNQPLIIDEVQFVPQLFRALKVVVDKLRFENKDNANGRYVLTGSANIMALPSLSDALVGRMAILTLYPFSVAEATNNKDVPLRKLMDLDFSQLHDRGITLIDAIKHGTFPEITGVDKSVRTVWFDSYITTILQRDVKQITDLEKSSVLPHLLRVLATRVGGLMNDSDISREVGLNSVTGKSYRNILKLMFLTFDVKPWYRNIGKRLVKAPKGYLLDTLMACHLLDYDLEDVAKTKPMLFGSLVENFVATELLKQLSNSDIKAELYHFRTNDGKEVDFIIEKPDGRVFAIEVKKSELVTQEDFKGIRQFQDLTGDDFMGGVVLYTGKEPVPFGKNLWAVPISVLW